MFLKIYDVFKVVENVFYNKGKFEINVDKMVKWLVINEMVREVYSKYILWWVYEVDIYIKNGYVFRKVLYVILKE